MKSSCFVHRERKDSGKDRKYRNQKKKIKRSVFIGQNFHSYFVCKICSNFLFFFVIQKEFITQHFFFPPPFSIIGVVCSRSPNAILFFPLILFSINLIPLLFFIALCVIYFFINRLFLFIVSSETFNFDLIAFIGIFFTYYVRL